MQTEGFYRPTDIDLLRMENELLAYENSFLKSRVAALERAREVVAAQPAAPPSNPGVEVARRAWRGVKSSPIGPAAVKLRRSPAVRRVLARVVS